MDNYVDAYIKVKVPKWQIGQEASVYFKDTMYIKGICQENKIEDSNIFKLLKFIDLIDNDKGLCNKCKLHIFELLHESGFSWEESEEKNER